ncbi:Hypothetical protein, putative [Bodo saltans]|uniref:Uncharacterized protein n=1 Tax=Bodo saltans TaxID=75058 RepID=A0A0S4KH99_BODSA|nr:Hypothetical protein, putative [Bodo saltans]|eukprot:CUI15066.1 Hypothetical protein, putative [Bodo saltans]
MRFVLYRVPFETPITVVVFLLLGVQCSLLAAKQSVPTWISLVQTLLTILRAVLRMISIALESDMEKFVFDEHNNGANESEEKMRRNVAAIDFGYYQRSDNNTASLSIREMAFLPSSAEDDEEGGDEFGDVEEEVSVDPNRMFNPINQGTFSSFSTEQQLVIMDRKSHHLASTKCSVRVGGSLPRRMTDLERHFALNAGDENVVRGSDDGGGLSVVVLEDMDGPSRHVDQDDDSSNSDAPPPSPPSSCSDVPFYQQEDGGEYFEYHSMLL